MKEEILIGLIAILIPTCVARDSLPLIRDDKGTTKEIPQEEVGGWDPTAVPGPIPEWNATTRGTLTSTGPSTTRTVRIANSEGEKFHISPSNSLNSEKRKSPEGIQKAYLVKVFNPNNVGYLKYWNQRRHKKN